MQVVIAGGGIGGLALALSLHQAGVACRVHEAVAEPRPLGVGINIQPHAVRELTELGLLPALHETGIATRGFVYVTRRGAEIWREPRGLAAGYRWPQFSIHRGRLQMLLLAEVRKRLGADSVVAGRTLLHAEDAGSSVRAVFQRREDGGEEVAEGSVLIACDGIHSALRRQFHPHEGPPAWGGAVLWRGTSAWPAFDGGATMAVIGHARQKFVVYPIAPLPDGRMLTNWIAEIVFDEKALWNREDWNRRGEAADFLPAFAGWRIDWLDLAGLVGASDAIFEYPMVDRDPLPRWTHGRMTLLGDAAHPMYPIGSNGASQAILDARHLAASIRAHGATAAALAAYESVRRPATSAIVLGNRGNGPDEALEIVERRAPEGFSRLSDVVADGELARVAIEYKRLAGMEPETLNARPRILDLDGVD
jgi:2-polyprenyl-6-methoxyphenol hydroxylase-like FAD-dependent oxidoreductase